jgi:CTP synthase (UTP-ammonia lyase)
MKRIRIGLVGDFDEKMYTLVAINASIQHCQEKLSVAVESEWIPTENIEVVLSTKKHFDGLWIVPGSPYKNDQGVYTIIRHAREHNVPTTGSCGGFQYMLLEYAKNVLNIEGAGHEESDPNSVLVISKLLCSLKGQQETISIPEKNSWLYQTLKTHSYVGKYYCSYAINPQYQKALSTYPLIFTAFSPTGEARAFELTNHRFFKGTLFQPALDSTNENPNPLILSFLNACAAD